VELRERKREGKKETKQVDPSREADKDTMRHKDGAWS
jgi:hypothetical protein